MKGLSNTVILIILFATTGALYAAYTMIYEEHKTLPVYGPEVDGEQHVVAPYEFTDQEGVVFNSSTVEDQVQLVNFFFTSCPTICPKMMTGMERIQKATINNRDDLQLISMTVDPKRDTPERLKEYTTRYDIDYDRWRLLTGEKKDLYNVARKGYYLVATDGDGGPGDFIHSEKLVLVDRNQKIRGYYDGTDPEEVNILLRDLRKLLKNKS